MSNLVKHTRDGVREPPAVGTGLDLNAMLEVFVVGLEFWMVFIYLNSNENMDVSEWRFPS